MSHTIRRTLKAEWPTTSPAHTSPSSVLSRPSSLDRRQSKSQGEPVRSLATLLRPTPSDLDQSGKADYAVRPAEKDEQHASQRHRPGSHHARKMLEKISAAYHRQAREHSQQHRHHHHHHLSHLFHTNEYPQSDDPSSGQSALERKKKIEVVYGQGLELARQLGTFALNRMEVAEYLSCTKWDSDAAFRRIQILYLTRDGVLYDIDPRIQMCGAVNSGGTTCYIDSLLVALFGIQHAYDGLLYVRGDLGSEAANQLQAACRLIANYLRAGELVDASLIEELRTALFSCGWLGDSNGRPPENRHTQQDVSELYLFLMERLQMPYLPLEVRMVHGADYDESDSRMVTQRVLELSLSDDDNGNDDGRSSAEQPLQLQALVERYFFDNRVEQLERNLKAKDSDGKPTGASKVRTNAWSILSMYPFYTPQSELGVSNAVYPDDAPLVVPLLVKRYRVDSHGIVHRIRRRVIVPLTMDVTNIVSHSSTSGTAFELNNSKGSAASVCRPYLRGSSIMTGSSPPPYTSSEQYRLVLRSAICHKGQSTSAGHYVSLYTHSHGPQTGGTRQPKEVQPSDSAVFVTHSLAKIPTMPASANNIVAAAEMCGPQELVSHRASGGLDQRRRSCPDLLASASSSKIAAHLADKQQGLPPPPYDAQSSQNTSLPDELASITSEFMRFDDMDVEHERVQRFTTREGRRQCLDEVAQDGYLLFYALEHIFLK
ncbi:hypothetical protein GGI20_003917 [Coemansia sp. BCRC 34301]|nr:hypothetical protein GGI20_003917 [Coemansia sp. BCRC 34301]